MAIPRMTPACLVRDGTGERLVDKRDVLQGTGASDWMKVHHAAFPYEAAAGEIRQHVVLAPVTYTVGQRLLMVPILRSTGHGTPPLMAPEKGRLVEVVQLDEVGFSDLPHSLPSTWMLTGSPLEVLSQQFKTLLPTQEALNASRFVILSCRLI